VPGFFIIQIEPKAANKTLAPTTLPQEESTQRVGKFADPMNPSENQTNKREELEPLISYLGGDEEAKRRRKQRK
jgi:hypothetical protein